MLFWFLFCDDIPSYVKFCDDSLCDDILNMLWWYCGDVVIQPHQDQGCQVQKKPNFQRKFVKIWQIKFRNFIECYMFCWNLVIV
jgi:hypothetical protein